MGMSTHIVAFLPDTDPEYQKHKKVLLACAEAKVDLPKQTAHYFGTDYPEMCVLEEKLETQLELDKHFTEYREDMEDGYEILLENLPKGIAKIRVYNSY